MVGVAGRSKACVTCKQRKIRCSLEQPECKVCIKSARQCGGYHRDRVFILDARTAKDNLQNNAAAIQAEPEPEPVLEKINEKGQELALKPVNDNFINTSFSPFNFWDVATPLTQAINSTKGSISTSSAFKSLWTIYCPSTRSIYRQQILSEFLSSYYDGVADPVKAENASSGWLTMLPTLPNFTTALEAAVLAICTARLGRVNKDEALVRESLKFYTQGLWELQKALWSPSLMYRDETVAACMALLMYEVIECPDKNTTGWLGHIRGCAQLVKLKGPKAYGSEFGHRLFVTFRQLEIQQAIAERRGTFLAHPAWIDTPWKGYTKPIDQYLLDLMAEMANVGEAGYYPKHPENPVLLTAELMVIVTRCWELDTKLQALYNRLERQEPGPVYWPIVANEFNPLDGTQAFPATYRFPDMRTAHTCIMYWAACSILWSGLIKIYEVLNGLQMLMQALAASSIPVPLSAPIPPFTSASSPSSSNTTVSPPGLSAELPTLMSSPPALELPPLGHRSDILSIARNICKSLPYYEAGLVKAGIPITVAVFPLKVAIEGLSGVEGCERELEWAIGNFQTIIGSGAQLLENLGQDVTFKAYLSS